MVMIHAAGSKEAWKALKQKMKDAGQLYYIVSLNLEEVLVKPVFTASFFYFFLLTQQFRAMNSVLKKILKPEFNYYQSYSFNLTSGFDKYQRGLSSLDQTRIQKWL